MLQPTSIEHTEYQNRPVIIATYAADASIAAEVGIHEGHTVYLGFYQTHDLTDMRNLFYPGDRMFYPNREEVFAEIDQFGFN